MALLTSSFVAYHLKVRIHDIPTLIEEDGLPHTEVPAKKRNVTKFMPYALYLWQKERSKGIFPTFEEYLHQIEADQKQFKISQAKKKKTTTT